MTLRLHDLETGLKNVRNQITAFEAAMDDALGHAHGTDLEDDEDAEAEDPSPTEIVQHLLKASDLGK
jgi:hypothetical protein